MKILLIIPSVLSIYSYSNILYELNEIKYNKNILEKNLEYKNK